MHGIVLLIEYTLNLFDSNTKQHRQHKMIRDEVLALQTNHEKPMLVNNASTKKGSVAQLMHCINLIEENNLNQQELAIIHAAIDEVLASFIKVRWDTYFSFQHNYIHKRYQELIKTSAMQNNN